MCHGHPLLYLGDEVALLSYCISIVCDVCSFLICIFAFSEHDAAAFAVVGNNIDFILITPPVIL